MYLFYFITNINTIKPVLCKCIFGIFVLLGDKTYSYLELEVVYHEFNTEFKTKFKTEHLKYNLPPHSFLKIIYFENALIND